MPPAGRSKASAGKTGREMKCKILVSTMNGVLGAGVTELLDHMIVVNQVTDQRGDVRRFHNFREVGLSRSRNRAIEIAARESIDIALISDNDVGFPDGVLETVVTAFSNHPEADIITFQSLTAEGELRKSRYQAHPYWHGIRSIGRVSSIEIAFRVESIRASGVRFDEKFGLGATFPTGEEFVFLADSLRHGLRILYVPVPVSVHSKRSSGGKFSVDRRLIEAKGAMMYRIFGASAYAVSALYSIKHHQAGGMSALRFHSMMMSGIRECRRLGS